MSKTPEGPEQETRTLRITEKQRALMIEASRALQSAQSAVNNIVTTVFAAHDMDPTEIIKEGQDDQGLFLIVKEPEQRSVAIAD